MINKKYFNIIVKDIWKDFEYIIKEWWDYYVIIVNDSIVYRFPKEEKNLNELLKEKKILDILKNYISIKIPELEIVWWIWLKYKIIKWDTMEKLNLLDLDENSLNKILDDIVLFLKELHSIPINNFNFIKSENNDYNIYRDKFKKEMYIRLKWKIDDIYIDKLKVYIDKLFDLNFDNQVLVHTDIQEKNIIFNYSENKISWVIDFTDCRISWKEQDFVHFIDWWEKIFKKIIIKYFWFYNDKFVNIVKFLHKKPLIFEIMNDDIYENNLDDLLIKIKNF